MTGQQWRQKVFDLSSKTKQEMAARILTMAAMAVVHPA